MVPLDGRLLRTHRETFPAGKENTLMHINANQ